MTALDKSPTNVSLLDSAKWRLTVRKLPNVVWFCQKTSLPGISLNSPDQPNPFVKIPLQGDHLQYEDLDVTFLVDEDMRNWREVHDWMRAIGFPKDFAEYKVLRDVPLYTGNGLTSDISLLVMNGASRPSFDVTFLNASPVGLSSLDFDVTSEGGEPVYARAIFQYERYDFNPLRDNLT